MTIDDLYRELTVYNVGPDQEYPPEGWMGKYEWAVVWYEVGRCDGDGEAVIKLNDGRLAHVGLGHCSCYGPWDAGLSGCNEIENLTDFIDESTLRECAVCGINTHVAAKVIELLDQEKNRDSCIRAEGDGGEVCERSGLQGHDDSQAPEAHPGT